MKRTIAALLAALLLLSLAACQKEQPPEPTPQPPTVTKPTPPEKPAQPEPEPQPDPEPLPPDQDEPQVSQVEVSTLERTDSIEDGVSYVIRVPQVTMEPAAAGQTINDYYTSVAGKLGDLAWGEVYEAAQSQHTVLQLDAGFKVTCNQDDRLSVVRTTAVVDQSTGAIDATLAAETFNLQNGGLLMLDDFFSVPEAQYIPRLTQAVAAQISNDPYHSDNYDAQWQSLLVSTFDKTQFYVAPDALWVFYQHGDLGSGATTTFSIPWTSLTDILTQP